MRPSVQVIGWYGKANCGDESYKIAFPKLFPDYDFSFSDIPTAGADAYILGGGDVISEDFLRTFVPIKAPKHTLSTTFAKKSWPTPKFNTVLVRDDESAGFAKEMGYEPNVAPDFAFALEPNPQRGRKLLEYHFQRFDLYSKVVAFVPNAYLLSYEAGLARTAIQFENFAWESCKVMDNTCASFVFLPFSMGAPADDRVPSAWISSKAKFWKKTNVIYERLSVQDTLDILSSVDLVVSMRLHSSIFSVLCGKPFIDVTHNHKNRAFLESVRLSKLSVPYSGFSSERVRPLIDEYLNNSEGLKNELASIAVQQRSKLQDAIKTIRLV